MTQQSETSSRAPLSLDRLWLRRLPAVRSQRWVVAQGCPPSLIPFIESLSGRLRSAVGALQRAARELSAAGLATRIQSSLPLVRPSPSTLHWLEVGLSPGYVAPLPFWLSRALRRFQRVLAGARMSKRMICTCRGAAG